MGMDDMRRLHALDREAVWLRYGQISHGFLYFSLSLAVRDAVSRAFVVGNGGFGDFCPDCEFPVPLYRFR